MYLYPLEQWWRTYGMCAGTRSPFFWHATNLLKWLQLGFPLSLPVLGLPVRPHDSPFNFLSVPMIPPLTSCPSP